MLEIERKFLLTRLPNVRKWDEILNIIQYYIEDSVRVREINNTKTGKSIYIKTIKTFVSPGINKEKEIRISRKKFWELIHATNKYTYIYKYRYKYKGWEIDEFKNKKLVVAEIELDSIDQKIKIPKWLKSVLIMEVTPFKEFSNYELSKR